MRCRGLAFTCAVALVCGALLSTTRAAADDLPSIDARTYRPSFDPKALVATEPTATPAPGEWNIGALASYTFRPVSLRGANGDVAYRPIEHVFGTDVVGSVGLLPRLSLGAFLPVTWAQTGSSNLPATVSTSSDAPLSAIGDLGLGFKGNIVDNSQGGFGLGGKTIVTLPTGDRSSFLGEGAATAEARVMAEYSLLLASVQASVGAKVRTERRTWPDASVGGVTFGDELPWSFGVSVIPIWWKQGPNTRERYELGVRGWLPLGPSGPFGAGRPGSAALSPVMVSLADRIELGRDRDTYILVAVDVGVNPDAVGSPGFRAIAGLGWAPRSHDEDGDGVRDLDDQCPQIPEDKDGFEDADGCPEIDDDEDNVVDKEDACPRVKGVPSKDPKLNGCPSGDKDDDGIPDDEDACPTVPANTPSGCPAKDKDNDGVSDAKDKCPTEAEDRDGFEDEDGCPDPDNDKDGVLDADDACPIEAGPGSSDPKKNGCPVKDADGDTYADDVDKCPTEPETFNGKDDDDGCPDTGGAPLMRFVTAGGRVTLSFARPIRFTGPPLSPEVDKASLPTLRALAIALQEHPEWSVAVGARPKPDGKSPTQDAAFAQALAVVRTLSALSRRDGVAETVGWEAVKNTPSAPSGTGFLVLVTKASP